MIRIAFILILSYFSQVAVSQESEIARGTYEDYVAHVEKLRSSHELVVVNFWATWCAPCVKEMPLLLKAREEYKNRDVAFLFVSLDFPSQVEARLIPYAEENKMVKDVFLIIEELNTDEINGIDEEWSGAIPITLFISNTSREIHKGIFHSQDEVFKKINQIIKLK